MKISARTTQIAPWKIKALQFAGTSFFESIAAHYIEPKLKEMGAKFGEIEVRPEIGYSKGELCITVFVSGEDYLEWLLNSSSTSVGMEYYEGSTTWKVYFPVEEVYCVFSIFAKAPLEDGDLLTLEMLGKVHREIIPARIETSVYCEF